MQAAVVTAFDTAPKFADFPAPQPASDTDMVVTVLAAGLHPRVRSQADGSHYASNRELPLVPGIDGVGRDADGRLRYFVVPDVRLGSMAEQTLIDVRRSVVLPNDIDPIAVAAAMNPAMSSWVALRKRIAFEPGQSVLVLGATGVAGQLAVQVAQHLGAKDVIAVGRRAQALAALRELGATTTVLLEETGAAERLGRAAQVIDVALDYLWGQPTADALTAIVPARADETQRLQWIQVGSVAGVTSPIPSAALRANRLQIMGSGQGSVSTRDILGELPRLAELISNGTLRVNARAVPLADVHQAWSQVGVSGERIVITPAQ